jgi:hypothetical protein
MRGLFWGLSLVALLGGCSDAGTAGSQDSRADEKPAETVFDPMTGTMDRAGAVEDLSSGRKQAMDDAFDGSD